MNSQLKSNEYYMQEALFLAKIAADSGEVPVGALIVDSNGKIISKSHNLKETNQIATGHAEIQAIEQACKILGRWRLSDCSLYVTLEPCFMCAGAIVHARIPHVIFGANDPKTGAVQSLANVLNDSRLNHSCSVTSGICEQQSSALLKEFFRTRRKSKTTAT